MTDREIVPSKGPPTSVALGPSSSLDLSWLSEEKRAELLTEHARGMLDLNRRAQELHVDVGALKSTLNSMTVTTREVSGDGHAVTISHAQTTNIGRTEILMGNTDKARKGRLSKTQTGEADWAPLYIVAGIIALVVIAAISAA